MAGMKRALRAAGWFTLGYWVGAWIVAYYGLKPEGQHG